MTIARSLIHSLPALTILCFVLSGPVEAQQGQGFVAGTVVDGRTLRPLSGVQIAAGGTDRGTITDAQGRFRIEGLSGQQVSLQIQMIGYQRLSQSVPMGSDNVQIALEQAAVALDAIVVTGVAGVTRARAVGNAVGRVAAEEVLERRAAAPSVLSLLSTEVPGLRIMQSSGSIGASANPQIRGVSSMSLSGDPLIYVDGVRVDNASRQLGQASSTWGSGMSRINDINPQDIESIEVIKGPAAATLYGTEATNGVIQIITKRGGVGAPTFDVSLRRGVNWLPDPFGVYNQELYTVDSQTGELNRWNRLEWNRDHGFDSPFETGHPFGASLSMRGGSDRVRYYVSGDYNRDEGIVSYNWQNRASARSNLTYVHSDDLDASINIGYSRQATRTTSPTQEMTAGLTFSGVPYGVPTRRYGDHMLEREGVEEVDKTTLSFQANHRPTGWLSQRVTIGTDLGFIRSWTLMPRDLESLQGTAGSKSIGAIRRHFVTFDYSATADWNVRSDLTLSTSAGAQFYGRKSVSQTSSGSGFPVPGVSVVNAAATNSGSESFTENNTVGIFLQEQLAWRDRVFLTAAIRGDDNSAFGANYAFVAYPKVSATWVPTDEPFWGLDAVSSLKLRAAWGQAGQQPSTTAAVRLYSPVVGWGGIPSLRPGNTGNPDLRPEVGTELELGFDFGLFNERVTGEFTFYNQSTRDAIVSRPALRSLGFGGNQFINLGEVLNRGIEVGVNGRAVEAPRFAWDLGMTFSTNHNEVVSLGGLEPGGSIERHVEGFPLGSIYMKKVVNAEFDAAGELINVLCEGGDPVYGGGPPVPCDEAGTAYWGRPTPAWEGSAHTAFTLFNAVRLSAVLDFVGGYTQRIGDLGAAHLLNRTSHCVLTRCDPYLTAYENLPDVDWNMGGTMDIAFAKLRSVSASYNFPASIAQRMGASSGSFSLSAENVATLWVQNKGLWGLEVSEIERNRTGGTGTYVQDQFPMFARVLGVLRVTF